MTANNQKKSISDSQLRTMHSCAKQFMTATRLQQLSKEKEGMILIGVFCEDFTDAAIAVALSLPEYKEEVPLFDRHWGYIRRCTEQQLTEIIIPYLRVRLNQYLREIGTLTKARLISAAKAYALCSTRLLDLRSSK